jgi:hypothetical protein
VGTSDTSGTLAATRSTTTTTSAAGPSYSATVNLSLKDSSGDGEYSDTFHISASLGTPTTSTENQTPGSVNVLVPVRGSASMTNNSTGYDQGGFWAPAIIARLYPKGSAVCKHTGVDAPTGGDPENASTAIIQVYGKAVAHDCALVVAELDSPNNNGDDTVDSGSTVSLPLTPNGSNSYPDGSGQFAPGNVVLGSVPSGQASNLESGLMNLAGQWIFLTLATGNVCSNYQSNNNTYQISDPSSMQGCAYGPAISYG